MEALPKYTVAPPNRHGDPSEFRKLDNVRMNMRNVFVSPPGRENRKITVKASTRIRDAFSVGNYFD